MRLITILKSLVYEVIIKNLVVPFVTRLTLKKNLKKHLLQGSNAGIYLKRGHGKTWKIQRTFTIFHVLKFCYFTTAFI